MIAEKTALPVAECGNEFDQSSSESAMYPAGKESARDRDPGRKG